jgi:hypothetical protein
VQLADRKIYFGVFHLGPNCGIKLQSIRKHLTEELPASGYRWFGFYVTAESNSLERELQELKRDIELLGLPFSSYVIIDETITDPVNG